MYRPDPGRTSLYRLYDGTDQLLYVGIATDPQKRINVHRCDTSKKWRHDIARHAVEWFETREEAEGAEVEAIRTELPTYNRRHHPAYDNAPWSSNTAA